MKDGERRPGPSRSPSFTFAIVELKLGFLVFTETRCTTRGDGYDDVLYSLVKLRHKDYTSPCTNFSVTFCKLTVLFHIF